MAPTSYGRGAGRRRAASKRGEGPGVSASLAGLWCRVPASTMPLVTDRTDPAITTHRRGPAEMFAARTPLRISDVIIRAAIVGRALAPGYIRRMLGGLLFTLNALGYSTAAAAMAVPLALAVRFRWF